MPDVRAHPRPSFSFSVESNGHGGFAVYLHAKGSGLDAVGLVGQWATKEEALNIAARLEGRLFHGPETVSPVPIALSAERCAAE